MTISLISPDANVQASIEQDDLVYKGRIPLNTSAQVHKAGLAASKKINRLDCPILLVHAQNDSIALPPKPQKLADNIKLKLFKTLRHNCIDGANREAAVSRKHMMSFIADKL